MFGEDILVDLGADAADPAELENILLSYFHRSGQLSDDTLIYEREERAALELKYSKNDTPLSLRPGPAFRDEDRRELRRIIREQLLTPGPIKVGRAVMFAALPVTGWFRFRDDFQILPVPPDAPRPEFAISEHPFLMEVSFLSSENPSVSVLRRGKRERQVELLCGLLLFPEIHGQSRSVSFHWVYEDMEEGQLTSRFRQGGYSWRGANFQADAFSATDGLPQLEQMDTRAYYAQHGVAAHQTLKVPDNFANSLELARALSAHDRERFLRAAYWYQQSFRAWSASHSIATAALVSAIESLRPDPPQGMGLRRAFMDFVDQFVPGIPVADRRRFYELRSAISHGGKLLHADEVAWGISMQHMNETNDMRILSSIVRAALINWLHAPEPRNE